MFDAQAFSEKVTSMFDDQLIAMLSVNSSQYNDEALRLAAHVDLVGREPGDEFLCRAARRERQAQEIAMGDRDAQLTTALGAARATELERGLGAAHD